MDHRTRLVTRLRHRLLRRGFPRFQMAVIVIATGLAGFGASATLLALGMETMALRYPLSVLAAYLAFLLLVRLWITYQRRAIERVGDVVDAIFDPTGSAHGGSAAEPFGGGGRFGGGGAGRSWIGDDPSAAEQGASSVAPDLDLDEGWVIVVPVVILAAGALAAIYTVYTAPALFAELLADGLLASGLYRRLRRLDPKSWLTIALRRTWIPVAAVAVLVTLGGFAAQRAYPEADSLGGVLRILRH